jgi:hypothetical protein
LYQTLRFLSKHSHHASHNEQESGLFEDTSLAIIGAKEANLANSFIREGARTALLWVHPNSAPQYANTSNIERKNNPITFASCSENVHRPPALIPQSELQNIVEHYKDVFAEVPPGLTPDRGPLDLPFRWNQIRDHLFAIFID